MVLARIWLERRDQISFEQGVEQTQKKWEAWNRRCLLAIEEGREFDEPHPRPDDE